MHLWPSFRLRDSFRWDYLKNLDRNLQRMKSDRQQRQRLNASASFPSPSSDPQPANSSSSLLLLSDVGDDTPQVQSDADKADGRHIPTTNWILVLISELFLILSCCYCCFCCGDSFSGGTPVLALPNGCLSMDFLDPLPLRRHKVRFGVEDLPDVKQLNGEGMQGASKTIS